MRVRFVHLAGDYGYDSLHGACMLERLAPPQQTSPVIKYEYDYVGGPVGGDRRALDSAFVVRYDNAIDGHKEWRQRNVTVVGFSMSTYSPKNTITVPSPVVVSIFHLPPARQSRLNSQ